MAIAEVTDNDFKEKVLKSKTPVLVDFWAPWCGPCKMAEPVLDELSGEYKGKVDFVKVNVDNNPDLAKKYSVRGIPTLLLLKNGEIETSKIGMLSKAQLTAFLDSNI